MIIETSSEKETFDIGERLGKKALPGSIYCLDGDLGAGKTVFAKGFARGLGIDEPVTSPTFTIVQEYSGGRLKLYHFDVYRLTDSDEFYAIGGDEYLNNGICIIEWGEIIEDILPDDYIKISFSKDSENENYRILELVGNGVNSNHIIENLN